MCEQAAEANKSKGGGHSSRRRMSSDSGHTSKSSVDAILSNSSSPSSMQVFYSPVSLFSLYLCSCQSYISSVHCRILLAIIELQFLVDISLQHILSHTCRDLTLKWQWFLYCKCWCNQPCDDHEIANVMTINLV